MTEQTQPTDAEISACILAAKVKCVHPEAVTTIEVARAVLAKWGSPVVAGEPVAVIEFTDGVKEPRIMSWNDLPPGQHRVFTTPQPTQAQAGAVPLTADQREALWESHGPTRVKWGHWEWHQQGIEDAERAHGIKGADHG